MESKQKATAQGLKRVLLGMTFEQRLLFMVRYAHAHSRWLKEKEKKKGKKWKGV